MTRSPDFVPPATGGSWVQEADGTLRREEATHEPTIEEIAAREAEARAEALARLTPAEPQPARKGRAVPAPATPAAPVTEA